MQDHLSNRFRVSASQTNRAPSSQEIEAFHFALDEMGQNRGSGEQTVNLLLDFFISRCLSARELRDLGRTLFDALNTATAQAITLGGFAERFHFRRLDRKLLVFVDDQRLATIVIDDASRLVDMLTGQEESAPIHAQPVHTHSKSGAAAR